MPRTSPYRLILTDAERTELEARARRYTSSYSGVMRAKIVLYAAEGLGNDEIAARLDTPRQVAQTLPRTTPARTGRSTPGRTAPEFFPLTSWSQSKRWPANCPPKPAYRPPAGTARTWPEPPSNKASSPPSRAPPSGAGSPRMPSNPGSTGPGSSPATPTSPPRPHACSTCTPAASMRHRWAPMST